VSVSTTATFLFGLMVSALTMVFVAVSAYQFGRMRGRAEGRAGEGPAERR
jgi:hypothetical protein